MSDCALRGICVVAMKVMWSNPTNQVQYLILLAMEFPNSQTFVNNGTWYLTQTILSCEIQLVNVMSSNKFAILVIDLGENFIFSHCLMSMVGYIAKCKYQYTVYIVQSVLVIDIGQRKTFLSHYRLKLFAQLIQIFIQRVKKQIL